MSLLPDRIKSIFSLKGKRKFKDKSNIKILDLPRIKACFTRTLITLFILLLKNKKKTKQKQKRFSRMAVQELTARNSGPLFFFWTPLPKYGNEQNTASRGNLDIV